MQVIFHRDGAVGGRSKISNRVIVTRIDVG